MAHSARWAVPGTDARLPAVAVDRLLALLAAPAWEALPDSLRWRVAQYLHDRPAFVVPPGFERAVLQDGGRGAARRDAVSDWETAVVCTPELGSTADGARWFEFTVTETVTVWAGGAEVGFVAELPPWVLDSSGGVPPPPGTHWGWDEQAPRAFEADSLQAGDRVRVLCDRDGALHVHVNGTPACGGPVRLVPPPSDGRPLRGIIGLYGQCAAVAELSTS